ncbi:HD domain-containing protein [Promethearchaeum syntrophicum]|uniref:HD domain-containing protein n=1 Tax=Promethearchaeum syntrophicum TaxID=2594042 RepID=A0A5B9D6M2_9ARCH|nr:HD domain-containing protein [Candidatus Prometheoarchaeum syntrophicum]QEE14798.1 HD domain protein [Candidatus Prometheoarchaeum syntrophicum]
MRTLTGLQAKKYILDPIHKVISLTQIELDIISTPLFQRLRKITQLGVASLVYPGATHNRFQHCLGTLHVTDKLLYSLELQKEYELSDKDHKRIVQFMRLAALLHDCGHLPFSHTFENLYENFTHEDIGKHVIEKSSIGEILIKHGFNPNDLGLFITGQPPVKDKNFNILTHLLPLLHSEADADRMDYLLRDAYFTGVPYGKIDIDRICNFVTLHEKRICFSEKAQDALEDFLYSRYQMYKIVYIHKTSLCYDLILHKIYENYLKKSKIKFFDSFKLPTKKEFEKKNKEWYETDFYELSEASFYETIQYLLKSKGKSLTDTEKVELKYLYNTIKKRKPIKNCYNHDLLATVPEDIKKKGEICEKENQLFENLQKKSKITNHWSFLRHDPGKPIRISPPINQIIDDDQDSKSIRILKDINGKKEIVLLQKKQNSFIKNLATHHRVLISYYHNDKKAQEEIQKQACEMFGS